MSEESTKRRDSRYDECLPASGTTTTPDGDTGREEDARALPIETPPTVIQAADADVLGWTDLLARSLLCGTGRLRQTLKYVGHGMYNVPIKYKGRAVAVRALQLDFPMSSVRDALMKYERERDDLAAVKQMRKTNLCTAADVDT